MEETYESSGVSIARGDAASVDAFQQLARTFTKNSELVKGLVTLPANFRDMKEPLLVLATDGVGTKLKYAFASGQHKTVGIDLVAMCVSDLARNNITPLGFALYRATSEISLSVMHDVVEGVVEGCLQARCVYTTGETAEMPGFYHEGEYDLAGFAVGVVDRKDILTGELIQESDIVFGIASSGLHSNGFSLVRKLFPPEDIGDNATLLDQILAPTRIYVNPVLKINKRFNIHGWAHITGGGIFGKLGKIIPNGLCAQIETTSWRAPEIFGKIATKGDISREEMFGVFNMGLGMIGIAGQADAYQAIFELNQMGFQTYTVGSIIRCSGEQKVLLV